ncbi:hypothetical protein CAEBREN_09032 [Caenorhabditis brenneri]|uniref:Uncharacterized protein n=1 Tax=Caenorhabditis brenneri TaxID=135651 RepID=G0NDS8_CAEBE|nr:hypothetical protein CAEBREN_09032 [Caenorhabditis brenneri]
MMDDVNQTTTDRSHGYAKERQGYHDLFMEKKDVQTRRSSWPDDEDIPDEFRIIPEPEGPYDDPVPIDPITEAENARVRKPLERTWNTGVYYC